jgi:hypothetical protein
MKKVLFAILFLVLAAAPCVFIEGRSDAAANRYESAMARWSRSEEYRDDMGGRFLVRATLYTAEYIDNLMQSEAEKNLWTASELEDYKYNFLKGLNAEDYIAIHLQLDELGPTAHMSPFNEMISLWIGSKKYPPADYDQRFNLPLQGRRDGMVYFPKYDEKTGAPLLDRDSTLRLVMAGGVSPVLGAKEVRINWDVKVGSIGVLTTGTAGDRIEVDRLLRRLERLTEEKSELESQLDAKDREIDEINARIEELQRK